MSSFLKAQLQTDEVINRMVAQQEKVIVQEYAKALQNIRGDLATAYEKYSVGGKLSYAEMAKYNRLANLEQQIFGEVNKVTASNAVKLKNGMGKVYQEAYYRTAFNVEKTAQAKLSFGLLNPKAIQRAIDNPLDKYGVGTKKDSLGFLIRNSRNQEALKAQIKSEISQGMILGKSYADMAKSMKNRLNIGATNTTRIVRTEGHRCQMQGKLDSLEYAKTKGVDMDYMWVATLDERTRSSHQGMDGVKTLPNGKFPMPGVGEVAGPGMTGVANEDINCRCSMVGVVKGFEPTVRRAREDGIIPYTKYLDYAKSKGWPTHYKGPEPKGVFGGLGEGLWGGWV